jgi:signal transduction histidine kinase
MPECGRVTGSGDAHRGRRNDVDRVEQLRAIASALHDLCQPLTALHCRLEIGQMSETSDGYAAAVDEALVESERLLRGVSAMRELVRNALAGD